MLFAYKLTQNITIYNMLYITNYFWLSNCSIQYDVHIFYCTDFVQFVGNSKYLNRYQILCVDESINLLKSIWFVRSKPTFCLFVFVCLFMARVTIILSSSSSLLLSMSSCNLGHAIHFVTVYLFYHLLSVVLCLLLHWPVWDVEIL